MSYKYLFYFYFIIIIKVINMKKLKHILKYIFSSYYRFNYKNRNKSCKDFINWEEITNIKKPKN